MTTVEKIEAINAKVGGVVGLALHEAAIAADYPNPLGFALLTFDFGPAGPKATPA